MFGKLVNGFDLLWMGVILVVKMGDVGYITRAHYGSGNSAFAEKRKIDRKDKKRKKQKLLPPPEVLCLSLSLSLSLTLLSCVYVCVYVSVCQSNPMYFVAGQKQNLILRCTTHISLSQSRRLLFWSSLLDFLCLFSTCVCVSSETKRRLFTLLSSRHILLKSWT